MNFEPQKFFIGLMDFFSILLPGALLTFLLMNQAGALGAGQGAVPVPDRCRGLGGFLFAS